MWWSTIRIRILWILTTDDLGYDLRGISEELATIYITMIRRSKELKRFKENKMRD